MRQLRIAVGQHGGGWYPNEGLVIQVEGDDWVIESVEPDPNATWHIDTIHRWTSPMSVLVALRPATVEESAQSAEHEQQDTDEFIAAVMKR